MKHIEFVQLSTSLAYNILNWNMGSLALPKHLHDHMRPENVKRFVKHVQEYLDQMMEANVVPEPPADALDGGYTYKDIEDGIVSCCPKCLAKSGDDWSQCGKGCPMDGSPHFNDDLANDYRSGKLKPTVRPNIPVDEFGDDIPF